MAHWRNALRGFIKHHLGAAPTSLRRPESADKDMKSLYKTTAGLAALVIVMTGAAWAQQPPAAPKPPAPKPAPARPAAPQSQAQTSPPAQAAPAAPVGDVPQQTTATYGDWILQCVTPSGSATEN